MEVESQQTEAVREVGNKRAGGGGGDPPSLVWMRGLSTEAWVVRVDTLLIWVIKGMCDRLIDRGVTSVN